MRDEYLNDNMNAIRNAIVILDNERLDKQNAKRIRALLIDAVEGFESEGFH